jgi:Zn-dependent peptidase ImmA (M78 family)
LDLKIDRMEIDDVGSNPKKLAEAIVKQLPSDTCAIPVREIARAIDIVEIREEVLDGLEGGLVVESGKSIGKILVHSQRSEKRKRFTIAHEIGHYVNPSHTTNSLEGFRCTSADLRIDDSAGQSHHTKMELQANEFAAELLMPESLLKKFFRTRPGLDLDHIIQMSDWFNVSKEAACRRYIERLDEPAALIFSKDGVIKSIRKGKAFPSLSVWVNQRLPSECISSTSTRPIGVVTDIHEVVGHVWLTKSAGVSLGVQTLAQQNGFRLTLLTIETLDHHEDFWAEPKFK